VVDYLNIDFASISEKQVQLYVYDMLGKLQFGKLLNTSYQRTTEVNFENMAPGMFMVKLIADNKSYYIKIIKSQ